MKARSVARELALFTLYHQETHPTAEGTLERASFAELVVNTVRMLTSLAEDQLQQVVDDVSALKDHLLDHELSHPDNANVPLEASTKPVPIPTTKTMGEHLEKVMQAIEALNEALYLPELNALSQRDDVQNYCWMLVKTVQQHQKELDAKIEAAAKDWKIERMHVLDRLILRLALAEIEHVKDTPTPTVIEEALELAHRFTTEESRKFIHGTLGELTEGATPEASHV